MQSNDPLSILALVTTLQEENGKLRSEVTELSKRLLFIETQIKAYLSQQQQQQQQQKLQQQQQQQQQQQMIRNSQRFSKRFNLNFKRQKYIPAISKAKGTATTETTTRPRKTSRNIEPNQIEEKKREAMAVLLAEKENHEKSTAMSASVAPPSPSSSSTSSLSLSVDTTCSTKQLPIAKPEATTVTKRVTGTTIRRISRGFDKPPLPPLSPTAVVSASQHRYPANPLSPRMSNAFRASDADLHTLDEDETGEKTPHEKFLFVMNKLLKLRKTSDIQKLDHVAKMLSDRNLMLATFLSKDIEATKETISSIIDMYSSNSTDMIIDVLKEHEMLVSSEMYLRKLNVMQKLKIKLVIVEQNTASHKLTQLISPVLNMVNLAPQFGSFHSALIVGPWYIEWNNSGLVIPRKCCSRGSVVALDIGKELPEVNIDQALSTIADFIVDWNTRYKYSVTNRNCHKFVNALCAKLGIKLEFSGMFGTYMQNLQRRGACEMAIELNGDLQTKIGKKTVKFDSHQQLDQFVKEYLKYLGPEDLMLLKSFDRAFWLRHFSNPISSQFKPHANCFFRNPIDTGSIVPNQSSKSLQF